MDDELIPRLEPFGEVVDAICVNCDQRLPFREMRLFASEGTEWLFRFVCSACYEDLVCKIDAAVRDELPTRTLIKEVLWGETEEQRRAAYGDLPPTDTD